MKIAHLVLVGCSAEKLSGGPHRPSRLYTSTLFRLASRWAQQQGDDWRVLSGGRGLLHPDKPLMSYDTNLKSLSVADRERWVRDMGWAVWVEANHLREQREADAVRISVLAGEAYCGWIPHLGVCSQFKARDMFPITVEQPLTGLQIGQRLQWLARETTLAGEVQDLFALEAA